MKHLSIFFLSIALFSVATAQTINQKLQKAYEQFLNDEQLKYATSSLYVIDATTGKPVFDKNSRVGLAPASTQKIITSVTAYEVLGRAFRYETQFGILNKDGKQSLYIKPSGDPTFGSWRWENTKEENTWKRIRAAFQTEKLNDHVAYIDANGWPSSIVPEGWIWQDIGNYYGAGSIFFNWRENQFDVMLKSGPNIGDPVSIVGTKPAMKEYRMISEVKSAAKGTGDNAYIYLPVNADHAIIRGTIPVNENNFVISGSMINPAIQFLSGLNLNATTALMNYAENATNVQPRILHIERSPSLDSIIYWFNRRSINLYGEALIQRIAFEKNGKASTSDGLSVLRKFWKDQGIDEEELNMYDGSGLSPLNRVTTHSQVEILRYAKSKDWFPAFFDALPEFNKMKMKSGTIADVKGFCGFHRSSDGKEYIFSFLVNNYSGRASALVNKMYKVLDVLK